MQKPQKNFKIQRLTFVPFVPFIVTLLGLCYDDYLLVFSKRNFNND